MQGVQLLKRYPQLHTAKSRTLLQIATVSAVMWAGPLFVPAGYAAMLAQLAPVVCWGGAVWVWAGSLRMEGAHAATLPQSATASRIAGVQLLAVCLGWALLPLLALVVTGLWDQGPLLVQQGITWQAAGLPIWAAGLLWSSARRCGKWRWSYFPEGRLDRSTVGMWRFLHALGLLTLIVLAGASLAHLIAWQAHWPIGTGALALPVAVVCTLFLRTKRVAGYWKLAARKGLSVRLFYWALIALYALLLLLVYQLHAALARSEPGALLHSGPFVWIMLAGLWDPLQTATALVWGSWAVGSLWLLSNWAKWRTDSGRGVHGAGLWQEALVYAACAVLQAALLVYLPPLGTFLCGLLGVALLCVSLPDHAQLARFVWYADLPLPERERIAKRLIIKDINIVYSSQVIIWLPFILDLPHTLSWLLHGAAFLLLAGLLGLSGAWSALRFWGGRMEKTGDSAC